MRSPLDALITDSIYQPFVLERVGAALVAGDDLEIGRVIREGVSKALEERRELEAMRREEVSEDELAQAFRDVYAAIGDRA